MTRKLIEIAADLVQTQAGSKSMTAEELSASLRQVFQTLQDMQKSETTGTALAMPVVTGEPSSPEMAPKALDPKESIQNDKVICLECGAEMRQLSAKHLISHGMDQKEYKKKYGFTMRTPLAAKSLTKARSKAAKKRGLPEKLQQFIETRRQGKAGAPAGQPATQEVEGSKPRRTRVRKQ